MRFLITGGRGQLGQEWVDFLSEQNAEFEALSSSELDITNQKSVIRKIDEYKPDVIINCAAYTKVDQAEDEQALAHLVNHEAVKNLAGICEFKKLKLVHFSTDYVFAGSEDDHQKLSGGYPEDYETNPINEYGASKLAGEQAIQHSGCDYLIIRVSWLCGKNGNNFVKTMIRLASEKDELKVVNDQIGCPTFTDNVVKNTYQLVKNGDSGLFHLTSLGATTWYEFATEIFKQKQLHVTVKPVDSTEFPTKAKRPAYSLLSTKKIANIPGIRLEDWKQGLKKLLKNL